MNTSIEARLMELEKEQAANEKLRSHLNTFAAMALAGLVSSIIMLITTNQTTNRNSEQIERMDERQRTMQSEIRTMTARQEQNSSALDRIETSLERNRAERATPFR